MHFHTSNRHSFVFSGVSVRLHVNVVAVARQSSKPLEGIAAKVQAGLSGMADEFQAELCGLSAHVMALMKRHHRPALMGSKAPSAGDGKAVARISQLLTRSVSWRSSWRIYSCWAGRSGSTTTVRNIRRMEQ